MSDPDPDTIVLEPDEEVLWDGTPRLMSALPIVATGLLMAGVGLGFAIVADMPVLLAFVPIGLAVAAWGVVVVRNTRFVVSDVALYRKTGVLSRNVRRMRLARVQNSTFRQGFRGRLFGYGTVGVEAAGGGKIAFTDIETPREVRALVERRAGHGDLPGTLDQWEAVLAETRGLNAALAGDSERPGEEHAG
jgi:uncharacterized membrane protein YdbT with pleckstrin-like domain